MDMIEPAFRPRYENICVGNKPADAQDVFFEGLLLEEGLGMLRDYSTGLHRCLALQRDVNKDVKAEISHGTVIQLGATHISIASRFVFAPVTIIHSKILTPRGSPQGAT